MNGGTHLLFLGPSTAGKSTLMHELTRVEDPELEFTVDRTWTTRQRRPNEDDHENIFVTEEEFASNEPQFLFTFQTFPTYRYGIEIPRPLMPNEVRMRIFMPVHAKIFRQLVSEPSLFCSITPFSDEPETIFKTREPDADPADISARLVRYYTDRKEADSVADICFSNIYGPALAAQSLLMAIRQRLNANVVS